MGATTDTCADMSWVLGDECGTVVRGLCQRPVFRLRGTGYDVRFRLRFRFGCVLGFGFDFDFWLYFWFRFRFCLLSCCLLLAFVHGSLYFSFGYVFCPRYVGIMLLEGGLTVNSYGLQHMSHL